jgi:hypothetical protein
MRGRADAPEEDDNLFSPSKIHMDNRQTLHLVKGTRQYVSQRFKIT